MTYKKIFFITLIVFVCIIFGGLTVLSLMSRYIYPVDYGISFHPAHATYLKLDWKEVYSEMITDLDPKFVRLAAAWNEVEPRKNEYNFSDLDWMLDEAYKNGSKVTLVLGQKIPRWPECHTPSWAITDASEYEKNLFEYLEVVTRRYQSHPALEIWQVENEPFIHFVFGECSLYDQNLVEKEVEFVRSIDPSHPILMTDSGELGLWARAARFSDYFGTTLYRVVRTPSGKIFHYRWLPPAFYRIKAKLFGINPEKNMFISELQGEPWFNELDVDQTPLEEQMQTMGHQQFAENLVYVTKIGVPRVYLWGVEWWYWMKTKQNDPWYWDFIKGL